jgi:hypothetical protein
MLRDYIDSSRSYGHYAAPSEVALAGPGLRQEMYGTLARAEPG